MMDLRDGQTLADAGQRWFTPARPVTEWIVNGQTVPGHEIGDLALPPRVLADPAQYIVIGRCDNPDGRWFLDFAISAEWVIAQSGGTYSRVEGERYPIVTCPECRGLRGNHAAGCPSATRRPK
jgi:hypothetical protein